ncbi:hypothetical protein [Erythrobacter crassostreae]|uniref:Uncharacterized protein n=1 Tax=Erythrobacter crassostreae TaxID=2828328 RepID=A0A9X1F3A6_9SPHN|nr:hypothetical protein [Erythrobacter crassostrea]MBV7259500.1 hypothetical protein [Erythrobacter crassostrea]
MPKRNLRNPVLFSSHFGIDPDKLASAGLLDPILNSDTQLFIDPLLVRKSDNKHIRKSGKDELYHSLGKVVRLLTISKDEGDAAWIGAFEALDLRERPETGLGYGSSSRSGSSRPPELRHAILRTIKEIISLGVNDLDMIPFMPAFQDDVGADTLSDLATNAMLPTLSKLTEKFSKKHDLAARNWGARYGKRKLPANPFDDRYPIISVPRDLLRELPIATDWSDVKRVISTNRELRENINLMFGNIAKVTVSQRKAALKKAALQSDELLQKLISAVAAAADSYDEKADLDGIFIFRQLLNSNHKAFRNLISAPKGTDKSDLMSVVLAIITVFQDLIEKNDLWKLLWHCDRPRKERAAQLVFFGIAKILCAANNIDINPESNSGGGPVDFAFSRGAKEKLVVEIKLSKGQVVAGYRRQLERYKAAAGTNLAVMLIIDVGGIGRKLRDIEHLAEKARESGDRASEIFVVDAKPQRSASKLR